MSLVKSLLEMSLAGGVMIAAVIAVRALTLRRLPKRTFPVLWYAALARLLVPLSLPCALSVYTLFARLNEVPAVAEPAAQVPRPAAAPVTPPYAPPAAAYAPAAPATVDAPPAFSIDGETVALLVWLLGAIVCAAFFAVVYLRSRREFNQSLPLENDFTRRWLDGHRLRRKISLRQSDRIGAPLTYGILRPVILMPKSTDWDDGEAVKYVLEHEFAHVRRFDAAGKLALTAAVCLHWFNPLVWVMYALANRDLELACDEAVLRRLGRETRAEYAMTLIRMAEAEVKNGPAAFYSGFGKSAVEERITAIMKMKKTSFAALLVAAGLVVGVTTVFATSAATADREELDRRANAQSATAMDTLDMRVDADGRVWYSEDGTIWYSEEQYDARYPATNVAQGVDNVGRLSEGNATAADFAEYAPYGLEWRETEKALYFKGERVRYFLDGAEVDGGTAVRLEYSDAQLKGDIDVRAARRRVSNADGSFDPMGPLTGLEKYSQAEFDARVFNHAALEAVTDFTQELDRSRQETEALLKVYAPFGLSWEIPEANDEISLSMSWNGKPVHAVSDTAAGVWIANNQNGWSLGPDAVDLEAVYTNGKLTGLKASPAPSAQTEAVASVSPGTAQAAAVQPAQAATTAVISQGTDTGKGEPGMSFAEKFAKYESIHIVYEEAQGASGKGNVYRLGSVGYEGKRDRYLISHFADVKPDGSVFTFDSADSGGLSVQTVYGGNGELSGITVTASPVTAEPLKNGEEVVAVNGLIYSRGLTSCGYVRATDFDPNGGLVPLYDERCNVIGCFNNAGSIEHITPKSPNKVLVDGYICIRALGTGLDGSYPVSGYIREIDESPNMGNTPEEVMEYINTHPDYGKRREIPLYDGEGNVIGSFEHGGGFSMTSSDFSSIDEAKDYLKNYGNDG